MKLTQEFKQYYLNEFSYLKLDRENYPLTSIEYQDLIFERYEQLLLPFDILNNEQTLALQNIYDSMKAIDSVLTPFRDAGIPYSLVSTGGALYDFLTGKHELTKDIDIVLHFNIVADKNEKQKAPDNTFFAVPVSDDWTEPEELPKDIISEKYQQSVHNLIKEHAPQLAHANHKYDMGLFSHLVQRMIDKNYKTSQIYTQKNFKDGDYVKMLLHSLIKVSDNKLNKPLDIMLSQRSPQVYCDSFDFNICKNYITYRRFKHEFMKEDDLATQVEKQGYSPQLMLEHMMCFPIALEDLVNRKYTMKLNTLRLSDINYYMTRHYPRIKEKLPEYELNFDCAPNEQHIANAYLAAHRHEKLQEKIPHKNGAAIQKKKI